MTRTSRIFENRPLAEREWMLENTWCDNCGAADLGMTDPVEYEEDGVVFVEGKCRNCGSTIRSVVTEFDAG